MVSRGLMRTGAVAAMVGAPIAVVFNLLHPRSDEFSAAAEVEASITEGIWAFDHYMLGLSVGLGFLALVVIGRSFASAASVPWGRVALYSAIGSSALAFTALTVDGFAIPEAADSIGPDAAVAVAHVAAGLFLTTIGTLFGITPILFGVAVLTGEDYPGWLGWVAVLAGLIGAVTGTIIFYNGFTDLTVEVLFPIASILFTVWIGVMGILLWRKAAVMPAAA